MPIYEYICGDCDFKFEAIRTYELADKSILCEKCTSGKTKRVISMFNTHSTAGISAHKSSCGSCAGGHCSTCN